MFNSDEQLGMGGEGTTGGGVDLWEDLGVGGGWVNLPGLISGWSWGRPFFSVYGRLFWETEWE